MGKKPTGCVTPLGGGRYRIRVQVGDKVAQETFEGTKAEANRRAGQMREGLVRGPTLREWWEDGFPKTLSVRGTPRSLVTMRGYRNQMERAVLPTLGDVPLAEITHEQVASVIGAAGSPSSCKRALSAVLRSAYDAGLMPERPLSRRVPVHVDHRPQTLPWTAQEASQALAEIPTLGDDALTAYLVLGLSGLRREEALGVRARDVEDVSAWSVSEGRDVETMLVTVAGTYTDEGGWVPRAKNEQSLRRVPVIYAGRDLLRGVLEGKALDERLVPLRGDVLYPRWMRETKRLGLRPIPPGLLRHTSDTLAITAGVAPDVNDKMHGRSNHTSTYMHYLRIDPGVMEDASRRVSAALGCADAGPATGAPVNGTYADESRSGAPCPRPAALLVGREGFEPSTLGLKVPCSAS